MTNPHSQRPPPEPDEDFDRVSRLTHKRLPFERKREKIFFWTPKETKAARGCFPSPPLATRKLLIPPQT